MFTSTTPAQLEEEASGSSVRCRETLEHLGESEGYKGKDEIVGKETREFGGEAIRLMQCFSLFPFPS